jgi:hypothetical protein
MSEDRGFEVVDRRRVSADETPEPEPGPEDTGGAETEEDDAAGVGQFTPNVSVSSILQMAFGLLHERGWVSLGLVPDPLSGKVEEDLAEARRAIDALADVARHLEADATPEEKRELQVALSNLRINFVQRSGR